MSHTDFQRPDEAVSLRLRQLYRRHGYLPYRMSKFESYDLYVRNKRFLLSENILTFTDTDGRLMALKPDVTLSIIKNTRDTAGALQKVYYNENVYRAAPDSGYREIMQTGLECIGRLDAFAIGEVLSLAARSLAAISGSYILDLSHMGFVAGLLEGLEEDAASELLTESSRKNVFTSSPSTRYAPGEASRRSWRRRRRSSPGSTVRRSRCSPGWRPSPAGRRWTAPWRSSRSCAA